MSKNQLNGPSLRRRINGVPALVHGTIAMSKIVTLEAATKAAEALAVDFPGFEFHVSGSEGSYKIIQYDKGRTQTDYL